MALLDPAGEVTGQVNSAGTALEGVLCLDLASLLGKFVVSGRRTFHPLNLSCQSPVVRLGECVTSVLTGVLAGRVQPLKVFCHLYSGTKSDKAVGVSSTDIFHNR